MCVKKLIKVGMLEGGGVQLDFPLKRRGGGIISAVAEKILC